MIAEPPAPDTQRRGGTLRKNTSRPRTATIVPPSPDAKRLWIVIDSTVIYSVHSPPARFFDRNADPFRYERPTERTMLRVA
jgi:hypothetical protein